MNISLKLILAALVMSLPTGVSSKNAGRDAGRSTFTGEILTLLYVSDVRKSVAFYKALGFKHDYYYDYRNEIYTRKWTQTYPPEYAEMIQHNIRIGLTTADQPEQLYGGGVRHYFMVTDVKHHYAMVRANGIVPEPNKIEVRPWMSFITISDPDNHQIVFGEKNQVYYKAAREKIKSLDRP